ncbi:hypothetical protein LTR56_022356 [Elasticomyces elasticus]|nr:hypothetical protein LTR56_022356 [Elasticomyces elasticus]KAK3627602.1 hypothetical protein LTR22_022698 [Elasticomyces elasticus]KAK4907731.1 hypothetical protein LTR49_023262 [Elasticomyces elasticus]KAK5737419.1 hypothetical protein LTS12_025890 [Elasticomyces elasticus]
MEQPSNIPGKTYVATLVTVPPNAATPPHIHNGAAVYAQVIKGGVLSQMIHQHTVTKPEGTIEQQEHDSGVGVYESGEMWYEAPGCRHVRAENASDTEEASFYANFIIDTEKLEGVDEKDLASVLTILDKDPRSPHYQAAESVGAF